MANPRQRRKGRSSNYKPVSHSRHAKRNMKKMPPVRGPKVLQDSWDKMKTVRQNYAALGLVHDLNPSAAGGVEEAVVSNTSLTAIESGISLSLKETESKIPVGYGRIVRDDHGQVIRIELPDPPEDENTHGNDLDPEVDEHLLKKWAIKLGDDTSRKVDVSQQGKCIKELERISSTYQSTTLSAALSGVGQRHASSGEVAYLRRLVDKYENNVERMARDRKLNPEQRTEGQLRRALKRAGFGV